MSTTLTLESAGQGPGGAVAASPNQPVAGVLHTLVLLVILLGGAGMMYFSAGQLRAADHPNRTALYLSTATWEWMLTAYVLWGVRRRGTPPEAVTGAKWKSFLEFARDFGIAVLFWFVALMVLEATASALHFRGSKASVGFLAPRGWMEVALWVLVCVTAGFCEETIFRGYLQKQFIAWSGSAAAGVVASAVVFGACHVYQGVKPATVITVYGLMFGILAQWRKSLRPGMMTHAVHDTVSGIAVRFLR
ncbi:MAG TPA: CPBP family intramembrane glutamic endopeptidase [Candidatus Sulfotelmatobacter sp.]|nr:CPBP family intramembrane glutamic endopeptidase [Candidatus Sulfotelmatobacter sp.]